MLLAFEKNSKLMNVACRAIYPWVALRESALEFGTIADSDIFPAYTMSRNREVKGRRQPEGGREMLNSCLIGGDVGTFKRE